MENHCRMHFGLAREPFSRDIATKDLMALDNLEKVGKRLEYLASISGVMLMTGEVGSGKSTALRWALSRLHPSEHRVASIVATTGTPLEFYRQIGKSLDVECKSNRISQWIEEIKAAVTDTVVAQKRKPIVVVDEANLLRPALFRELHVLGQFEHDSKSRLSLVLCGLSSLLDRIRMRGCEPLSSRVVTRFHLDPLDETDTGRYLEHHLKVAGCSQKIFTDEAVTAVFQGCGGLPRRINGLCRGAMEAAALAGAKQVTSEHVRIGASELI